MVRFAVTVALNGAKRRSRGKRRDAFLVDAHASGRGTRGAASSWEVVPRPSPCLRHVLTPQEHETDNDSTSLHGLRQSWR